MNIPNTTINPKDPFALIRQIDENYLKKLEQTNPDLARRIREADARTARESHKVDLMGGG